MLYLTRTYPALDLNAVTYMYVSGTEPECCYLYVRVTAFRFSVGHVHVDYNVPVQWQLRTCKLQHPVSVLDTYM
jgi:hypothetical protein